MIDQQVEMLLRQSLAIEDLIRKKTGMNRIFSSFYRSSICSFIFRFDIWPGYRWDGVDRSNGYEKKLFESIANRHAKAQEAYLWSVEDM